MLALVAIIGIATGFNFLILIWKWKKGRYIDFLIDVFCLVCICNLFAIGITAIAVGMIASMIISIWLILFPVRLFK